MARFEALIAPVAGCTCLERVMEQLRSVLGGRIDWINPSCASIHCLVGAGALELQVLLELKSVGELTVLISSRERMGSGAPHSRAVLERVVQHLLQAVDGAMVRYRSDRDGPVRHSSHGEALTKAV